MASGDSIIGICNLGLVNGLGQDPISALTDNRKAAILCNLNYEPQRRAVLRAYSWNFATKRQQIPASTTAPAFGFANAFQLPADFIRVVAVGDDTNQESWKIEAGFLVTDDSAPLDLRYIYDCQDPALFDPSFVQALAYALAAELAIPLTQDKSLRDQMTKDYEFRLSSARNASAQGNSAADWDNDILLRARD